MLSAFIPSLHSYPAVLLANNWYTSGKSTLVLSYQVDPLKFLRPRRIGTELSHDVLNPNRVPLNGRTAQPLGPTTAPGCDEPTSRCQTLPVDVNSGGDKPVIPRVLLSAEMAEPPITKPDFRPY